MTTEAVAQNDLYPSRVADAPHIIPREDPVVYPGGAGPLTAEQLASYDARGFLVLPRLFPADEAQRLDAELLAWAASPEVQGLEETITERGGTAVRSIFRVHRLHRLFADLARDARLRAVAEQILGSRVYLHQSRVNLKPGFTGKDFYWHSDFETWHVEDGMPRMRALSVSLALTENVAVNGPLMLMPGSHRSYVACVGATPADHYKQSLKKQEYGTPDPDSLTRLAEAGGIEAPIGPPGTAVFFDCNTMHGSNSNISPFPRRNVFFVYNSVENTLTTPYSGLAPRPEHIATRETVEPLDALPGR
jgi:ectoine hydroxylase